MRTVSPVESLEIVSASAKDEIESLLTISKDIPKVLIVSKYLAGILIGLKDLPKILIVPKDLPKILTISKDFPVSSSALGSPQDPHHHRVPSESPINL